MRLGAIIAIVGVAATGAVGQPVSQALPAGIDPATGARPGNDIGTGSSLPMSNRSSNISPGDTTSVIAPNLPSPPRDTT